jgi:hypothetical protein
VSNPNVLYDANAAGTCLQTVAQFARGCDATAEQGVDSTCRKLLVGTLPRGSACTSTQECAPDAGTASFCSGLFYDDRVVSGTGECAAMTDPSVTHGQAGDECVDTCDGTTPGGCIIADNSHPNAVPCFMSDGLYCPGAGLTCQPLLQLGQSCSRRSCIVGAFCDSGTCALQRSSGPCQRGADNCSSDSFCNAGQCELKRPLGSSCQSPEWCQVNQCVPGQTDNSATCGTNSLANDKACTGNLF